MKIPYRTPKVVCSRVATPEIKKIVLMSSLRPTVSRSMQNDSYRTRGTVIVDPNAVK